MAVVDDNLIIKTFMGAKITNPPYPQKVVDNNGQYHENRDWLDQVIEEIACDDLVTVRYLYDGTIMNIIKYIIVDGKQERQLSAVVLDGSQGYDNYYKTVLSYINKVNAL